MNTAVISMDYFVLKYVIVFDFARNGKTGECEYGKLAVRNFVTDSPASLLSSA